MPHYDYRCVDCDHTFEVFQRMSDSPLKVCPECSGTVEKLMSAGSGLIFKGSGFYITDYKNGANKGGSSSGGDSSDNATTQSESKSEAKSEAKTEKKSESKLKKTADSAA